MASGGGGRGAGFGRGGRGAALLQALAKSQKPGGGDASQDKPPTSVPTVAVAAAPPAAPLGRGSLLQGLRQSILEKQQKEQEAAASSGTSIVKPTGAEAPAKPMGRGLADMKLLLNKMKAEGGGLGRASGRGMMLAAAATASQASSQTSSPAPSETSESTIDRMRGLQLEDKPQNQPRGGGREPPQQFRQDRQRKPTVTMMGEKGKPVRLSANYVRLLCNNEGVFQYHVHFTPIIDNKRLKMKLLGEHKPELKTGYSFDGSILYLPYKLPDKETIFTSIRKTDGSAVTLKVQFVKQVPPAQCAHLYNVVFRRIMYILDMCQVQRYFYNPHTPASIPQRKLEVWPGYITAVQEEEGGLMLLLDASHKVLRTETVHDIMEKCVVANPSGFKEDLTKKIVGSVVLTRYNNKTYKVDDIVWSKTPMDKFASKSSGEHITFCDYYKTQHNLTIQNQTQPLLLHKRKPDKGQPPGTKPDPEFLCLIPELCYMCGLTDDMRQDFQVMKDLAVHTRVTPSQRQTAMKKFVDSVNRNAEATAELATWGLELDKATIDIQGRQLAPEQIYMGRKDFSAGPQADWSRDATRNILLSPVDLRNWGIFFTRRDASKANDFIRHMQTETKNMGINCQAPFRKELVNEKIETLVQELRKSIDKEVQLVVVINPTNRDDRYAAIKKVCCVEAPVPSQVIVARTISKPDKLRSVVQKIALQINCKLGGELWAVKIPLKDLMVVGIDSYHDNLRGKQSVGGVVCSLNKTCTRWYSNVCIQKPGQELVHGLQMCLTNGLRKYFADNHTLPQKIVIFRDGVGDGQLDILADHEVKQLHRCFKTFGEEYQPLCSTVVVQKRINARIFSKERDGSVGNPGPGTVVDHAVTRRDRYDYFIVSQHVRQGTVSPTHYIVVDDGIGWKPDYMQGLTYKMTHLYYNWPGTVRVPAPCQYAHKLAYLVGENIHKEPAECLSDRLFFL